MYNANIILVDGFLDSLRSLETALEYSLEMTKGAFARNDNGKRYGDGKSLK